VKRAVTMRRTDAILSVRWRPTSVTTDPLAELRVPTIGGREDPFFDWKAWRGPAPATTVFSVPSGEATPAAPQEEMVISHKP
jgi:hypothetical protein